MTRALDLVTPDPEATRGVAAALAAALRPGDVVGLSGELGAGKTCFVQGAAAALGVTERVTSPSFLLRREYDGRLPGAPGAQASDPVPGAPGAQASDPVRVLHFDVYRLETLSEVADLGYDDALAGDRITFIEWSDAMRPLLPDEHLEVELRLADPDAPVSPDGAEPRRLRLRAHGEGWARRLAELDAALAPWRATAEG